MSYKRVIITKFGGPETLRLVEEKTLPEPKAGEVRIKVLKTSANFTDTMIRKGKYPAVKDKPPFSPGYDMVGVVDQPGKGATEFRVGERVADMTVIGAYSEYICLPESRLIRVPENVDPSAAVSLILSYMTAYQMLHRMAKIDQGKSILIHGAGGAVGTAMLQLGKLHHLKMYGTASESKHNAIKRNGGTPIDYTKVDFVEYIRSNGGVDAVFDPIGGEHFNRSFKVLIPGGTLVAYGFYNAVTGKGGNIPADYLKVMLWNILPNRRKVKFYSIGPMRKKHPERYREDLQNLFHMLEKENIKPEIEQHAALEEAGEVHRKIENAENTGKIIFDVSSMDMNK